MYLILFCKCRISRFLFHGKLRVKSLFMQIHFYLSTMYIYENYKIILFLSRRRLKQFIIFKFFKSLRLFLIDTREKFAALAFSYSHVLYIICGDEKHRLHENTKHEKVGKRRKVRSEVEKGLPF